MYLTFKIAAPKHTNHIFQYHPLHYGIITSEHARIYWGIAIFSFWHYWTSHFYFLFTIRRTSPLWCRLLTIVVSVSRNYVKCKYIFVFPQHMHVWNGLSYCRGCGIYTNNWNNQSNHGIDSWHIICMNILQPRCKQYSLYHKLDASNFGKCLLFRYICTSLKCNIKRRYHNSFDVTFPYVFVPDVK